MPAIPTSMIVAPMLLISALRLRRFYIREPVANMVDPDFLTACAAVIVALGTVLLMAVRPGDAAASHYAAAAALAMGVVAAVIRYKTERERPPF